MIGIRVTRWFEGFEVRLAVLAWGLGGLPRIWDSPYGVESIWGYQTTIEYLQSLGLKLYSSCAKYSKK